MTVTCAAPARGDPGLLRAEYAELLAAARAAVAAARLGWADPLYLISRLLAEHDQLPPEGADPQRILAGTEGQQR
jgi:hypothetical protein